MKKYFDALNGFTTGVVTFFTDLGSKLKDVAGLIIQFDFEPMLKPSDILNIWWKAIL